MFYYFYYNHVAISSFIKVVAHMKITNVNQISLKKNHKISVNITAAFYLYCIAWSA